jgi:hypothetical protein
MSPISTSSDPVVELPPRSEILERLRSIRAISRHELADRFFELFADNLVDDEPEPTTVVAMIMLLTACLAQFYREAPLVASVIKPRCQDILTAIIDDPEALAVVNAHYGERPPTTHPLTLTLGRAA